MQGYFDRSASASVVSPPADAARARLLKRCAGALAAAMLSLTLTLAASAQVYPAKAIRLVTSGTAGSIPDSVARPLAERLSTILGQPVIVDNRAGAGGIVAMEIVAKAPPDGYVVGMATMNQLVLNRYLFAKLPYDPTRDVVPVIKLVAGPVVIAAHRDFPANSLQELIALARTRRGAITYAVPTLGTPPHIFALMIAHNANIELTVVAYRGAPDALASVVGGHVPILFDAPLIVAPHVRAGTLKALAVTSRERTPLLPDTPTVAEAGLPNMVGEAWLGLVVPSGAPARTIAILSDATNQALLGTDLKLSLQQLGWHVVGGTPSDFAAGIREDHATWERVIRQSGLRLE